MPMQYPRRGARLQLTYVPENQLPINGRPEFEAWPPFDPEVAGTLPENHGSFEVSGVEAAVAILAARMGKGKPTLQQMILEATGASRRLPL
jgi:hypothetical protein